MSTAGNLQRPNSEDSILRLSGVLRALFRRSEHQFAALGRTPRQINRISLKKDLEVFTNG